MDVLSVLFPAVVFLNFAIACIAAVVKMNIEEKKIFKKYKLLPFHMKTIHPLNVGKIGHIVHPELYEDRKRLNRSLFFIFLYLVISSVVIMYFAGDVYEILSGEFQVG